MAESPPVSLPACTALRTERRQGLTLAVVLCATFMSLFDVMVVNVAIPTVQRDLHASFAQVQFVIAGYVLAYAVTLVTGGRLGDIYGRKRLFMLGMAGFTLASALCGLASVPLLLIIARVIQGLAAAAMSPQVLSIIQMTFTGRGRTRALAMYGVVIGGAATAGQVGGGLLVRADLLGLGWRPVFLVNVPIGLVALIAARGLLAESHSATAPRLDVGGVAILTTGLFLLTFPLVEGRDAGWPPWAFVCLVAAVPVLVGFVLFERRKTARTDSPLVVLRLFRQRAFVAGICTSFLFALTTNPVFFIFALYLQLGLHYSPFRAGLTFAVSTASYAVAATLSVKLIPRLGSRLIVLGLAVFLAVDAGLAFIIVRNPIGPPVLALVVLMIFHGLGGGSISPPLVGAALAGIDKNDAGAASGTLVTFQQIGTAVGVALIGVIFFGALAAHAPSVSSAVAPTLARQRATTPAGLTSAAAVADFQRCANDRARSRDPAIPPASCASATLQPADSTAANAINAALQEANARNYAYAYVVSVMGVLIVLGVAMFTASMLPGPHAH